MSIDRWSLVHQFNKLVKQGLASPITGPDGSVYIVRIGPDTEPVFWLPSDDSVMNPGALWWSQFREIVDKADLDSLDGRMVS